MDHTSHPKNPTFRTFPKTCLINKHPVPNLLISYSHSGIFNFWVYPQKVCLALGRVRILREGNSKSLPSVGTQFAEEPTFTAQWPKYCIALMAGQYELKLIIKVLWVPKSHWKNMPTKPPYPLRNAATKNLDNKIQSAKSNTRSVRSFLNNPINRCESNCAKRQHIESF